MNGAEWKYMYTGLLNVFCQKTRERLRLSSFRLVVCLCTDSIVVWREELELGYRTG